MKLKAFIVDWILPSIMIIVGILIINAVHALVQPSLVTTPREPATASGVQTRVPPFQRTVLSAGATTTVGSSMNVADYQLVGFTVAAQGLSSTIKVACSMADTAPNFATSSSASNQWDYVNVIDDNNNSGIIGGTGLTFANSTTVRQVTLQNSLFRWCTVNQSSWTAGTTTVTLLPATNQ